MTEYTPAGSRALAEVERRAFQRLSLTPGHWAALGPAPLFYQPGLRAPNRRYATDRDITDSLRLELRTMPGLSAEAGHFWDRLGDGGHRAEAVLATRLLAWHLATDLPFSRRRPFLHQLRLVADHFAARNTSPPRTPEAVSDFARLVDGYLPYTAFVPDGDPPPVSVPPPDPRTLDAIARRLESPPMTSWPMANVADVPRLMPELTYVLGEPVRDWWGHSDPARRAVERGLASHYFAGRQRLYAAITDEWVRLVRGAFIGPAPEELAQRFVIRLREWVDTVRRAARDRAHAMPPPPPAAARPVATLVAPPPAAPHAAPATPSLPVAEFAESNAAALPNAVIIHPDYLARHKDDPPLPPVKEDLPPPAPPATPIAVPRAEPESVSVSLAEGFTPIPFDAALASARQTDVNEVCAWVEAGPRLLFDDCRPDGAREIAVVRDTAAVPPELWIVGDLHADVLALANIVAFADARGKQTGLPPAFVFLGDFVDRGIHDHELLLMLFRLLIDRPGRVCVVPGNHDTDLRFDDKTGWFRVSIEPAEYCVALNAALERNTPDGTDRAKLARAFVRFCSERPKALFLPDGTLVTHGGFPHIDVQKDIAALADLCQAKCLDDFMWARIAESARVKRPNRSTRGHEFGWDTFAQFCKLATEKLGLPVRRLVRGHDHVPDRWQEYRAYADAGFPVLTVNAMGRWMDCDAGRTGHPFPVVARYVPGHLPEVVRVPLDPAEVDRAFNTGAAPELGAGS